MVEFGLEHGLVSKKFNNPVMKADLANYVLQGYFINEYEDDLLDIETSSTFVSKTILKAISFSNHKEFFYDQITFYPYPHLTNYSFHKYRLPFL